jgi:hypothetical protein
MKTKNISLKIHFDELRIDISNAMELHALYAAADLKGLDATLLYSRLTAESAVFEFHDYPSQFKSPEEFVKSFRAIIIEISAPIARPLH